MKNPLEEIINRGDDPTGHGYFGAKRGDDLHKGFDLAAAPGTAVFSMITGKVTKIGYCYSDALQFRYIEITNSMYRVLLLYVGPMQLELGDAVEEGQKIGEVQDIATHWGNGMINHLHVEIYKNGLLTDPEPIIALIQLKEKSPEVFNHWNYLLGVN